MNEKPIPGEWQKDPGPYGRRFRMVGNIKEYEPDINGLPESVFWASQKAAAERKKAEKEEERRRLFDAQAAQRSACPFKKNVINKECTKDCPFYYDTACILSSRRTADTRDTAGAFCPICGTCKSNCALYQGGCTLIQTIKTMKGIETK